MNTEPQNIIEIAFVVIALLLLIYLAFRRYRTKSHENEKLKSEFLTIVAHKFRTPLTHIKWISDEQKTSETDSYKRENWEAVENSNKTMIDLVNTLIELADSDASSVKSYNLEVLSFGQLVKEVTNVLKDDFHRKNIFFSVKSDDDTMVKVDKSRLGFVIQVLLENALMYTPTGHNVEVAAGKIQNKAVFLTSDLFSI